MPYSAQGPPICSGTRRPTRSLHSPPRRPPWARSASAPRPSAIPRRAAEPIRTKREKYWPAATPSVTRALILSVEGSCGRSDGSLRAAGPIIEGEGDAASRQGLRGQDGAAEQDIEIGEDGGQRSHGGILRRALCNRRGRRDRGLEKDMNQHREHEQGGDEARRAP